MSESVTVPVNPLVAATVMVVGCQPERTEDYEPSLSLSVQAAMPIAARRILELATSLAAARVA